jgi:ubiquitin fusion degradation protein 1
LVQKTEGILGVNKPHLENGDKIVMPDSALERLLSLSIECPVLFKIKNPSILQTRHPGLLEFTAEKGMMYMPYWMMQKCC